MHIMENKIYITVTVTAELLGVSKRAILNYLYKGVLQGKRNSVSGYWLVDYSSLQQLQNHLYE